MGTNMSLFAERRVHGHWHFLGEMEENPLYEYDPEHQQRYTPESLYDTENESLCSILADVRNSGVLEEKYDCITSRRGLPEDLSPELKTFAGDSRNQHWSTIISWLTLKELVTFDWRKIRKQYAIVDKRVVHLFHPERGFPYREWPQGYRLVTASQHKGLRMPVGPKRMPILQSRILWNWWTIW